MCARRRVLRVRTTLRTDSVMLSRLLECRLWRYQRPHICSTSCCVFPILVLRSSLQSVFSNLALPFHQGITSHIGTIFFFSLHFLTSLIRVRSQTRPPRRSVSRLFRVGRAPGISIVASPRSGPGTLEAQVTTKEKVRYLHRHGRATDGSCRL